MIPQLTLNIALRDDATFENFHVGENNTLVAHLKSFVSNAKDKYIYLYGPESAGKTHLLTACCHAKSEQDKSAVLISLAHYYDYDPEMLEGMEYLDLLCLDGIHFIAGNTAWEQAIFHLYNRIVDTSCQLMIASHTAPRHLSLQLPDLISRLTQGTIFSLKALSDEQKVQAVQLHAMCRGMQLPDAVADFLLRRITRDMASLIDILEKIDQAQLVAKRPVTIPFVKTALGM